MSDSPTTDEIMALADAYRSASPHVSGIDARAALRAAVEQIVRSLSAWEQVWEGIRDNHEPNLNPANKPLAVAAIFQLAINRAERADPVMAAPEPDAKEENLATMARIGALRCEGGPHSPTGFLLRQLADAFDRLTAAPAPEPVAWIQADHLQKARTAPFLSRVEPTQRLPDFVPLYLHPAPVAAPDADKIMRKIWNALDWIPVTEHDEKPWKPVRAAVEQLVRERDKWKDEHFFQACLTRDLMPYQERAERAERELADIRAMDSKAFGAWQKERDKLQGRCERAEQDAARLREAFAHWHVSNGKNDVCAECGLDLRDPVHRRLQRESK